MDKVVVYDTTLRDGAQTEGISFSVADKLKIARRLVELGFDYVEGGWPGSNPKDLEFFGQVAGDPVLRERVTAFGSTRRKNTRPADDENLQRLCSCGVKTVTLFGKTWDLHVTRALNTTLEENLAMIRESVAYLKEQGLEVIYDAEHFFDGYKENPDYALATLEAAVNAGASTLVLCDTNGGSMPWEVEAAVRRVVERFPGVTVGIHAHNDTGMAVANTVVAVKAGARHVQGTVNGYGERCGNADLCAVLPNLTFKCGFATLPRESFARLVELSRYVSELANVHPYPQQPYVGMSAFAHKGGVHVSAIMKEPRCYEHIDPALVGNRRRVLVSELAGQSNLLYKLRELNLDLPSQGEVARQILAELKELERQGFQFESAEASFELLVRRAANSYERPFVLESLRILTELKEGGAVHAEATIKLRVGDKVVHTAAEGNGPVNALDNALRKALEQFYPAIRRMRLVDYKVRVLDGAAGTGAVVRVLIETGDGQRTWVTVGVSPNIIEASWQALADSFTYGLLKQAE
ncbi:citramalate synthase [Ammonifex thiophilus]|uniref:Citramalate synthase n=1 Tax=Ammonifex thiophilus TaxID=444093 RepID=A0A3D8P793_9THEO|nr:citramalate synthase [Ammonifex thiophilus]RDV84271.1 citramalate synthase [Ammonifex thiophilus]